MGASFGRMFSNVISHRPTRRSSRVGSFECVETDADLIQSATTLPEIQRRRYFGAFLSSRQLSLAKIDCEASAQYNLLLSLFVSSISTRCMARRRLSVRSIDSSSLDVLSLIPTPSSLPSLGSQSEREMTESRPPTLNDDTTSHTAESPVYTPIPLPLS